MITSSGCLGTWGDIFDKPYGNIWWHNRGKALVLQRKGELSALSWPQPEGWLLGLWYHVPELLQVGQSVREGLCLLLMGRAAWAREAAVATDASRDLDLGTDHLLSIRRGLRCWRCTWSQCQEGMLPPGGHLSCATHSSSVLGNPSALSTQDHTAMPALPGQLFPRPNAGSTDGIEGQCQSLDPCG